MSVLQGFLWMFGWFFLAVVALAWCIDALERFYWKDRDDAANEPEVDQDQSLR
ncbi:hypothetical protein SEA_LONEWOLF_65 [Mycobacterium phage LoneWolf]|nr:hypothetical protein SEA_LONEWOLF_65 [Mycobacterium phage LoneWolf]